MALRSIAICQTTASSSDAGHAESNQVNDKREENGINDRELELGRRLLLCFCQVLLPDCKLIILNPQTGNSPRLLDSCLRRPRPPLPPPPPPAPSAIAAAGAAAALPPAAAAAARVANVRFCLCRRRLAALSCQFIEASKKNEKVLSVQNPAKKSHSKTLICMADSLVPEIPKKSACQPQPPWNLWWYATPYYVVGQPHQS